MYFRDTLCYELKITTNLSDTKLGHVGCSGQITQITSGGLRADCAWLQQQQKWWIN